METFSETSLDQLSAKSTQHIRVAHLIHTMAYGGIETALLNWLKTMDRDRFTVSLFCFANPGQTERPFVEAAAALGISVRTIPWSRRKPVIKAARLLRRYLQEEKIEILHCHNTYADVVGLLAARLAGVKTVNTLYVWGKFGFVRDMLQRIDRFLLPHFDQVTAHCEETMQGTIDRGYPPERLKLLPCGFESTRVELTKEERCRRREELGADSSNFVLIHIARFWPEKAHEVLLESFAMVVDERPEARLWLLGVGPRLQEMQHLASQMGLDQRVQFLGFRTDLSELIALADMQVHPSDSEGVPLAICEGMAAGLPIVATRVGGLAEVIQDGVSGVLIEKRAPRQCADAILGLIDDPLRRTTLGREAARFIEDQYSLKSATLRVEKVYEELAMA